MIYIVYVLALAEAAPAQMHAQDTSWYRPSLPNTHSVAAIPTPKHRHSTWFPPPALHCRVLPPDEINRLIPSAIARLFEKFGNDSLTVYPYWC